MLPPLRTHQHTTHRAGFTLVELMVTIVITVLVISATYTLMGSSSEVFHHQEVSAENQNNLRFAIEQVRQDAQRAGYHLSPNTASDPFICPKPASAIQAIRITPSSLSPSDGTDPIPFDELIISGDFSGMPSMRVASIPDPSTLQVDLTTLQDALPGLSASDLSALFSRNFRPQQLISVTNQDGFTQFSLISSIDADSLTIYLSSPLQRATGSSSCGIIGVADQMHEIHPIHAVRYTLVNNPDEEGRVDLIRSDINPLTLTPVPNSDLQIASHIVSMRFLPVGVANASSHVSLEDDADLLAMNLATATSPSVIKTFSVSSHRTRFLNYRIQTRTHRAVPRRLAVPESELNASGAEFLYRALPDNEVAEVRTLQGKIELPNYILRDLK
jgi:prepilin-type N-terminal cleavage/methylation domain-containing protein